MKRFFTILAATLCAVATFAEDFKVDGIYYNASGSNATVIRGSYTGEVVIPSSVTYEGKTYSVTSIGDWAFSYCSSLTSVTIPNSVTSIGDGAFYNCSSLTSIEIPNSVTSIGDEAFSGCSGLTSMTIPNSVTSIGGNAFYDCYNLTSVTIGESVTSIGDWAFSYCSSLTSITIPNSVTSIGEGAFSGCSSLTSINVDSENPNYTSINGVLYNKDVTELICCPGGKTSVTIPESVTSIGDWAFAGCSGLTSVTIPNSVTSIGNNAFSYCSGLTSVTIPNSVTSIGNYAFYGCSGLTSITIPNSVTSIGDEAFRGCYNLTSVTIPESVTSIGDWAFGGCYNLTSVTIPESVTSIGESAFRGCSKLTSVTIGNSVTSIGESAFRGCSKLTSVTIGNSVTSIGEYAFSRCSGLTQIECKSSVPPVCGINEFGKEGSSDVANIYANCTLVVPTGSGEIYKNEEPWKNFNIVEFGAVQYNIVAVSSGGGTITGAGKFGIDETVIITATASEGYIFEKWTENGAEVSTANPYIFTVTADVTLVAVFKAKTTTALEDVAAAAFSAYAAGGTVYCSAEEFQIFTINGTNVTNRNGNLPAGVYVVVGKEGRAKVVVK